MSNRLDAIKDLIDMQNEQGYLVNKLNNVSMEWLIKQAEIAEKQAEIIEGQQTEIDWLRSLPLTNG